MFSLCWRQVGRCRQSKVIGDGRNTNRIQTLTLSCDDSVGQQHPGNACNTNSSENNQSVDPCSSSNPAVNSMIHLSHPLSTNINVLHCVPHRNVHSGCGSDILICTPGFYVPKFRFSPLVVEKVFCQTVGDSKYTTEHRCVFTLRWSGGPLSLHNGWAPHPWPTSCLKHSTMPCQIHPGS